MLGLEFPPVSHLIEFGSFGLGINKVVLIYIAALIIPLVLFYFGTRNMALVPSPIQTVAESSVEFIDEQIIMQTIGADGKRFRPLLAALFIFILFANLFEVVPLIQLPGNARMAMPAFLAIIVYVVFMSVGLRNHGLKYITGAIFPPGVPKALYLLVTPIEFVTTFIMRPATLAIRLFANMLAGHLLLVTFAVLTAALWQAGPLVVILPVSFAVLVGVTGFELLVALLQAYIFTILTAVYIGGALHPEH